MSRLGRGASTFAVVMFCILCIPLGFFLLLRTFGYDEPRDPAPPGWVDDFAEYLKWQPSTRVLQTAVDEDGDIVLIAEGRWGSMHSSGPPAYVFAADGRMLDWIEDSWEGFWCGFENPAAVTKEEALSLVQGQVSAGDWRARHLHE